MDIIESLGNWAWWIIAGLMFILELMAPALFFLWFGFAAVATGLLVLFVPMDWQWQVSIFAVLTIVLLLASRQIFGKTGWRSDKPLLNKRLERYVGKTYVLETAIRNGHGKVKINDTFWNVEGPEAPAGSQVTVTGAEGSTLIVELSAAS
ncbi:MAG: NfeD family protein [Hyphomicrobiales bacterium]